MAWEVWAKVDLSKKPHVHESWRRFSSVYRFEIIPVDERQAIVAREAWSRYGKLSRHPAKLNFGDCFAYALAKVLDEPLLFKGNDFIHTDIRSAI